MNLHDISLLPNGISDALPKRAFAQHIIQNQLLNHFYHSGYQLVAPPLFEFADNLLALNSDDSNISAHHFRTTDPDSHRTLGFRADITPQIARMAMTSLKNAPRPLQLCYAGEVVRIKGGLIRAERQYMQLGCELIGNHSAIAQAELLYLAIESLHLIGIEDVHIDVALVNIPQLLADWLEFDDAKTLHLKEIFANKMLDQITHISDDKAQQSLIYALVKETGTLPDMLTFFNDFELPQTLRQHFDKLNDLWNALQNYPLKAQFHLDFARISDTDYHDGWLYSFFAKSSPLLLGRGGAYQLPLSGEPAVGFSFYMDCLLQLQNPVVEAQKLLVNLSDALHDKTRQKFDEYKQQGYQIIHSLDNMKSENAMKQEAQRLECTHYYWQEICVTLVK